MIPWNKVRPVGGRVKVILEPPELLSETLLVVEDDMKKAENYAREWGMIVAMGDGAFKDPLLNPDSRIKISDMAIFKSYSGQHFTSPDGKTIIRIMNDTDIWACIDKEDLDEAGYDSEYSRSANAKELIGMSRYYNSEMINKVDNDAKDYQHEQKMKKMLGV